MEATATYNLNIKKDHNLTFLAGTSYENYRKDQMDATAKNMNSNDFFSFNYYDTSIITNTELGDAISPWSMMSYFGRFNYNFAEKYLFEANIRYDGSSRLAPDKRWKAFPSVSAAWRVNQENFLKNVTWLDNLKFRLSWGELGNGAILGLYDYIPTISDSQSGRPATYIGEKWYYQSQLASKEKTWETIQTTNVGIDFGAFQGRLAASFDYYWKFNDNMLSALQLPHTIGISVPRVNVGSLKTWGWDFEMSWRDHISDFSYQVSLNISDSQNKLVKYDGASVIGEGNVSLLEGYELNTIWGYKTQGYWASRDEYLQYKADHPGYKSFNDGKVSGGDTKYLAQGEPDHQIGVGGATPQNSGDLVYLGNSNPRYVYGINLSAQWKGFDFNVMMQGVGKRNILIDVASIAPFYNTYQMPWTIHRDYWTEDNQDAYWPRLYNYSNNDFNFKPSDKWMQDASYLRLKNITLGYTIPVTKKYIQKLRVYLSGNDIWERTNLIKVFDPEVGNNVSRNYYPFFRTWAFGVNVTF
ncbi:MAG: SusC/RagA family TonB-linked outer membrane protein [Prevotella sp.]|nr:SusC/RagA family TonB-linked outer membrane protein [Prevotella sp.]MDD4534932.1 SusC/RagA family TonB-linked outer membrane protein [Prevotella sp.]